MHLRCITTQCPKWVKWRGQMLRPRHLPPFEQHMAAGAHSVPIVFIDPENHPQLGSSIFPELCFRCTLRSLYLRQIFRICVVKSLIGMYLLHSSNYFLLSCFVDEVFYYSRCHLL